MMRRSLINFWFLLLLFLSGLPVQAQFIIENSAGDLGTSPVAEDINVCFEQEDALSFRLIATEAISAPLLSIELALGREYLDGTAAIVSQSGGFLLGPNTGTATQPQFIINGDFASGDFIEISLNRVGNCEAINQNGLTDRVSIAGSSEVSSTHDALFLTLSISGINPVTTNVGDMLTLDGQLIGGGNGCVEALVLMVYDEPGVTTNELRVEGNVIPLDSTVNDTLYYTLGLAEITQVGDSDECLEALETLDFERDVTITSCEVGGGYVAWWGCNDERCFQTEFTDQQINIEFNVPDVNYTGGSVPQPTNLCDTIIVRHDFTNVGTGAAFNVRYFAGFGASGLILSGNTGGLRNFPVVGVCLDDGDGLPNMTDAEVDFVLASNPGLTAFVDRLTIDPDGPGGLSDMDGDGFFDDLPAGESFSLFLKHEVLPEVGCPANRSSGSYKVTTEYTDQCEEDVARVISNAAGNFADFTADGPGSLTGPQDIFDMDVFTVQICGTQRFSGSMVSCPTDTLMLQAEVPSGFSLVSATATRPLGTVEQVEDTIFARVDFADNVLICFDLTLQLDCSEYDGRTPFDFTYRYLCDEACGVEEIFSCPTYNPIIHCPAPCPQGGLTVRSTEAVRATLGFANPLTCEEFADPATLSQLQRQRAQPCDTVCINVKSVQIDGLSRGPDASWDNAYFSIQYDPFNTAANNNLSYAGGTLEIWDASTGNFVVMDCPLPAPDTEENINNAGGDNDLHRMNFNLSSCLAGMPGGVLEAGDSVNINLKVYVEKDGALDDDVPTQLPDILIRTYNLVDTVAQDGTPPDGTLDTVTCDRFSLELYLHETTFGGGGGLRGQRKTIYSSQYARNV